MGLPPRPQGNPAAAMRVPDHRLRKTERRSRPPRFHHRRLRLWGQNRLESAFSEYFRFKAVSIHIAIRRPCEGAFFPPHRRRPVDGTPARKMSLGLEASRKSRIETAVTPFEGQSPAPSKNLNWSAQARALARLQAQVRARVPRPAGPCPCCECSGSGSALRRPWPDHWLRRASCLCRCG